MVTSIIYTKSMACMAKIGKLNNYVLDMKDKTGLFLSIYGPTISDTIHVG